MSKQPERNPDPYVSSRENNNRQLRRFFDAHVTQSINHHFLTAHDDETVKDILLRATKEVLNQELFSDAQVLEAYKNKDESTSRYSILARRALDTHLLSLGEERPSNKRIEDENPER